MGSGSKDKGELRKDSSPFVRLGSSSDGFPYNHDVCGHTYAATKKSKGRHHLTNGVGLSTVYFPKRGNTQEYTWKSETSCIFEKGVGRRPVYFLASKDVFISVFLFIDFCEKRSLLFSFGDN